MIYKAAVVGLGIMGNVADGLGGRHPMIYSPCCHADVYEVHPRTELVAGSTRSAEKQALFQQKRGDKPVYSDYREMLKEEKPDIVSIATPATNHAEIAIEVAKFGVKGIYCEKAMAVSLAECDRMIEICEQTDTVLMINHQRRWDNRYIELKRFLEDGNIGSLQAIQISLGGSRLCRSGTHMFDLALMFADDGVKSGLGWLSDPDNFDSGGVGFFETQGRTRLFIDVSAGMNHYAQVDLVGQKGIIKIIDDGFQFEYWVVDQSSEFQLMSKNHLPLNYPIQSPWLNAIDDLLNCIETGEEPRSSGCDGRSAFEMIVAIHQSHHSGHVPVLLPLDDRNFRIESN
ncbi:MAG: hypothetical protein CMJ75_05685 [Planctomycetaceae bacterium]|nr:hypothetical protein [Planctomycetaceae bacterium]